MVVSEKEATAASLPFMVDVNVTFGSFAAKKDGAFLFKFEIPVTQMGFAMHTAIFTGRCIETSVLLLGEAGVEREPLEIGMLTFERLVFNRGGDSVLTLRGEQLEKMSMKSHEIRELLEQSMVLKLQEYTQSSEHDTFSSASLASLLE